MGAANSTPPVNSAALRDLDPAMLYALLRLRVDVFVVEQECAYPELDGRDLEPSARHFWTADTDGPTSYVRVLTDPDGTARIGRVCTRADVRGAGLSGQLMTAAIAEIGAQPSILDAQSHLAGWYARFGYAPAGDEFLEDGIPHLPMRRVPQ